MNLSYLKIATFVGINDSPIAPTESKAGNGSHLIDKFNSLVSEAQILADSVTPNNQKFIPISNYNPGGFDNIGSIEEKYLSCGIGANSAFKIQFPNSTKQFISQWAIDLNSSNDESLTFNLVGKFNTESLVYRYDGISPNGFGVYWYRGARFADGTDLNVAQTNHLNLSIVNDSKELHIYNTTENWLDLLARVTYNIVFQID